MDTGVEYVEIAAAEVGYLLRALVSYLCGQGVEIVDVLLSHRVGDAEVFMTHGGEARVVAHAVDVEPPAAEHGGHEGSGHTADVDEYVEYLEAGVALRAVFGIVVQLAHYGLEIAFEEAVAEGDEEEREACEGEEPCGIARRGEDGHGEYYVAHGHHHESRDDGALVILGLVGDISAHKAEHVDARVEEGIDEGTCLFVKTELGAQEQHEDGIHDIVSETLAHVAQRRRNETFGMILEHRVSVVNDGFGMNDVQRYENFPNFDKRRGARWIILYLCGGFCNFAPGKTQA